MNDRLESSRDLPLKNSWNFRRILSIISDRNTCINWCQEVGLLPTRRKCPQNGKEWMKLEKSSRNYKNSSTAVGLRFMCRKHNKERTICENTWFEHHIIHMEDVLLVTYMLAAKASYKEVQNELRLLDKPVISNETISDIFSFSREVCMLKLDQLFLDRGKIGGPGKIVEIDEMKFGRRKYERGRVVEGKWIFGVIQVDSKELRLEICPNNKRDTETLLELIQKHILPGTTIFSDSWKAYEILQNKGYNHLKVNHSIEFVCKETGANTQMIESQWRPLRLRLQRGGVQSNQLDYHLCEYLWQREVRLKNLDPFAEFIKAIRQIYPGKSC